MITESIDNAINSLQTLKSDLMFFENRLQQLEKQQSQDDQFFRDLERLIKDRNNTY